MNQNLMVVIYTLFIYLIGGLFLIAFDHKSTVKRNLFLNIGLSFSAGNAVVILLVYILAFSGKLGLIQPGLRYGLMISNLLMIIGWAVYQKKNKIKFKWQNWLLFLGLVVFLLPLIKNSFYSPLNYWDALGVWLIKAKALFYFPGVAESGFLREGFYSYTHLDYPLGLPLLATAFYRLADFANDQAVQFYLLNYFVSLIMILTGSMIEMTVNRISLSNVFLVILLIIEIPNLLLFSHNGYADIPIALFMTAAMKLFLDLYSGGKTALSAVPMIILMTLASASIKVEGYPFIAVIGCALLALQLVKSKNLRKMPKLKTGLAILIGLSPIIMLEIYKAKNGIGSTYTGAGLALISLSKLKTIFHFYLNELMDTNRYLLTLVLAFLVYVLEILLMISKKMIKLLLPHLIPFLQLAAYTSLYLISPNPLEWQLSSFERISLPLIGMLFILIFYNFNCLWPEKNK